MKIGTKGTAHLLQTAALGLGLGLFAITADGHAQEFPSESIKLTMGFGPGSGIDANARMLAPYLEESLGVPITIINQPGGGSVPWANDLARAEPDGYTIGMIGFPLLQNNFVLSDVDYDPTEDYTYLGVLTLDPAVLAVSADSEFETISDLVEAAKSGERISIGATGKGSVDFLIALSIEQATGVDFGIVNFDSTNEGVVAALGGSLSAMPMTASSVMPYLESGQLRALAAGKDEKVEGIDAPTFAEANIDLLTAGSARAFLAPAGLPEDVKGKLESGIKAAIDNPEFREKAAEAGLPIVYMNAEETETFSESLVDAAQKNLK